MKRKHRPGFSLRSQGETKNLYLALHFKHMKKNLLQYTLVFALMFIFGDLHSQYVWTQKAAFTPGNRAGAFYFSVGSKGYVGSGIFQAGPSSFVYINDLWEYDPINDTWTQKATIPAQARAGASGLSLQQHGYVVNGYTGSVFLNETWEYDALLNIWMQKANFGGAARYTCASFELDAEGYVGMGKSGGYYSDFYKYNANTNIWTVVASIPGGLRQSASGFSVNGFGYVVGGANDNGTNYFDLYQYNPVLNSWVQKASYPGYGSYATCAFVLNGKVFAGTGSIIAAGNNTFDDFYSYDQLTDLWSQILSFAGGIRNTTSFFTIGNKAYAGLGASGIYPSGNYQNDWWEFADVSGTDENNFPELNSTTLSCDNGIVKFNFESPLKNDLQLLLFDVSGKEIASGVLKKGTSSHKINLQKCSGGIYFYRMISDDSQIKSGKFLIR
jgi:N-acetylneuraminic acid mutarotase